MESELHEKKEIIENIEEAIISKTISKPQGNTKTPKEKPEVIKSLSVINKDEIVHVHQPFKQTFHVGMLLFGCGSGITQPIID